MEKIHLQSKTKINQYFPITQQIKELYQLNPPTTKYQQMPLEKILLINMFYIIIKNI